jgi:hypothetical protein
MQLFIQRDTGFAISRLNGASERITDEQEIVFAGKI